MSLAHESVVFVHSTGTGPILWAGVPEEVLGGRRKLTPSNLGYAPSPLIERGVRVAAKDDATHLLKAIEKEDRIHLVAHSYGAFVALLMMHDLGDRLASLFMYEPVLFGALGKNIDEAAKIDPAAAEQARSFLSDPSFLEDEEKLGRSEWLEVFIDYWNRPGSWSRMPQAMREQQLAVGWKMSQEVRSAFFDNSSFDEWPIDTVPTTIMFGQRTTAASRAMSQLLAREPGKSGAMRANVTLVEAPGIGHMAPLVAPAAVYAEIGRHLAQQQEEVAR
jgi:pimeloyl-ACP methyl ester carboxylesterase